jgi:hypothetical protein
MTTNTILKEIHNAVKAGAAVCFIIMALFSSCKDAVKGGCTCPNGTVHENSTQPCCAESDCACTVRKTYPMSNGMPLTIENHTKNDVSIYAAAIANEVDYKISSNGNPTMISTLLSRGLKIIIENQGSNSYNVYHSRTIDNKTSAVSYEFLSGIVGDLSDDSSFLLMVGSSMFYPSQLTMQKFLSPVNPIERLLPVTPKAQVAYEGYAKEGTQRCPGTQGCLAPFCLTDASAPDTVS